MPRGEQQPSHPGFVGARDPYDCRACMNFHAAEYGYPPLDEENGDAWGIYLAVSDQVRIGMEVVGLDYSVLPVVWDLYRVPEPDRRALFEKIQIINRTIEAHHAKKREAERLNRRGRRMRGMQAAES